MKPILLFCLALTFALTACEKVVYIKIDEADRKIVLNGLICPDSTVVVHVSRSSSLGKPDQWDITKPYVDPWMADQVSLYEDDRFVGQLHMKKGNFLELPGFRPLPGKAYRLEASQGEMKPVSATVHIPELVPLTSFDTTMVTTADGKAAVRISFRISDPAGQKNYYALQVSGSQRYFYDPFERKIIDSVGIYNCYPSLYLNSDDILGLDFLDANRDVRIDGKLFFNDQLFNGKAFDISFELPQDSWYKMADTVNFRIDLHQVDKSYYLYAVSQQKYSLSADNPFVEPVQVYSNVTDGFGLFSAYIWIRKEVVVDWTKW
ncbi:MAG: DUF4249 domain-containing protein [Bacteroidales bacterium]